MCRRRGIHTRRFAVLLLCICVMLTGALTACGLRSPSGKPEDMTLSVRCSANCSFDMTVSGGHVYIKTAESAKRNCSFRAGEDNVTVVCPAEFLQWPTDQGRRHGYPAMLNASS